MQHKKVERYWQLLQDFLLLKLYKRVVVVRELVERFLLEKCVCNEPLQEQLKTITVSLNAGIPLLRCLSHLNSDFVCNLMFTVD